LYSEFIDDNGNCVCDVTLSNGVEVKGYGKNKRLARESAYKKLKK
jgi:hypothetical protein